MACVIGACLHFILLLGPACFYQLKAQVSVPLDLVEIKVIKYNLSLLGKHTETIDSLTKEQFRFNSLADILNYNSQVSIKSYGPGAIATTALRGGNASQTAVIWNGFNLQNAMLGQTDLSLLPSVLFDNVEIEYGGSSSLWGSGAVGGSIRLNNSPEFSKGFKSLTNIGAGSFGWKNASTALTYSYKRFVSSTKLYLNASDNRYEFKDTSDKVSPLRTQSHAAYTMLGGMQDLKFILNNKQTLALSAWANLNQRELPSYIVNQDSKTYQQDKAMRITANWAYNKSRFQSTIRSAFFNDKINYNDSLTALFSKSNARTFVAENENYFQWGRGFQFNTGLSYQNNSALSESYAERQRLSKLALMLGNKLMFKDHRILIYTTLRGEYFSNGKLPITGHASAEYEVYKNLKLSANIARVYRQPTLNELYWLPGGNPYLKPEEGYAFEGSVSSKKQLGKLRYSLSASAYSRKIDNWILWVPGAGGNPSPLNVQQVWSRGTETNWKLNYLKGKWGLGFNFMSAYVLSTVSANAQENNASKNRQLIYTPRYAMNGSVSFSYDKTYLCYYHQYTGYRFTSSDNTSWLNPFQLSSIRLSQGLDMDKTRFSLYLACNNIFNVNYVVMQGRPMPLRSFEFGISFQAKNNLTKQTQQPEPWTDKQL